MSQRHIYSNLGSDWRDDVVIDVVIDVVYDFPIKKLKKSCS